MPQHHSTSASSVDGTESIYHHSSGINTPLSRPNPFSTPPLSSRSSWMQDSRCHDAAGNVFPTAVYASTGASNRYFRSRRIRKEDMESPKIARSQQKRNLFQRQTWLIPCIGIFIGLCLSGVQNYFELQKKKLGAGKFCPVFIEDFSSGGLSADHWTIERQVGGPNGEFDEMSDDKDVIFVENGMLHIKPKLQDESLITTDNATIDLGELCTGEGWMNCYAHTNTTNGTIVPPTKSARINTKKSASIRYGRVEVTAKLPKGDWLWPAIWMLPTTNEYGPWPASGEIDIVEARGNNHSYVSGPGGGNNWATSALHWGPEAKHDSYLATMDQLSALHSDFGDKFHTFGLEWTKDYLYTYVDSVLLQVLYVPFNKHFWDMGNYPASTENGTSLTNPWAHTGKMNTPFDQKFYLILNVAVGGTNGYFKDARNGKPWADASPLARKEFWDARDSWYPTWKDNGAMQVKSVKMWEQC